MPRRSVGFRCETQVAPVQARRPILGGNNAVAPITAPTGTEFSSPRTKGASSRSRTLSAWSAGSQSIVGGSCLVEVELLPTHLLPMCGSSAPADSSSKYSCERKSRSRPFDPVATRQSTLAWSAGSSTSSFRQPSRSGHAGTAPRACRCDRCRRAAARALRHRRGEARSFRQAPAWEGDGWMTGLTLARSTRDGAQR